MDEIIASCPFCRATRVRLIEHDVDRWCVVCDSCEATGPAATTAAAAVEAWAMAKPLSEPVRVL